MSPFIPSRRAFTAGLALPFLAWPALAAAQTKKLVVVICRGGMDGLSLAPPIGDPDYAGLRGRLALGAEALRLDSDFSLHPSMRAVHALAKAGQARIAPAVASPDRARSHFEAQDVLETGAGGVYAASSGWLNRAVTALSAQGKVEALSVGPTAPLILRGPAPAGSWSQGRTVDATARLPGLLQDLYRDDPLLGPALARGLATETMAQAALEGLEPATAMSGQGMAPVRPGAGRDAAARLGQTLAGFMRAPGGPSITAVSADGFDTHANQGAAEGQLALRLASLDGLLDGLHRGLGPEWANTVVIAVTEFGRTARINGTGGTDHGTASTALLLGGALRPGGLVGDWPTLSRTALYEDRDLAPTLDTRALFKGVLADHMGVDRAKLDTAVFPGSAAVKAAAGLI